MKPIGLSAVAIVVLSAAGLACAGDGLGTTEPEDNDDPRPVGTPTASFREVQPIFTQSCALSRCHSGVSPAGDMNLVEGLAYANIVDITSSVPSLKRVRPGLPDSSFLVHKIQGTQASVGGAGLRMPAANCCLSQDQIDLIRSWIAKGALNN